MAATNDVGIVAGVLGWLSKMTLSILALTQWARAIESLRAARHVLPVSPHAAASCAYYAVFYAVCAFFGVEGKSYRKHSALEAAVHRDLVNTGRLPTEFGRNYSRLLQLRITGDYGNQDHVSGEAAANACDAAEGMLRAIAQLTGFQPE